MSGLILPAGSPLVQFEVRQFPHGGHSEEPLPLVLWVDRRPGKKKSGKCGGPTFRVSLAGEYEVTPKGDGYAAVCLCMGRFIE